MDKFTAVGNQEIGAIEEYYNSYLRNPLSVNESWRIFFEGFELASKAYEKKTDGYEVVDRNAIAKIQKEFKVLNLINAYRQRGHLFTRTNPVRKRRQYSPNLDIQNFGLDEHDLDTVFHAGNDIGIGPA